MEVIHERDLQQRVEKYFFINNSEKLAKSHQNHTIVKFNLL